MSIKIFSSLTQKRGREVSFCLDMSNLRSYMLCILALGVCAKAHIESWAEADDMKISDQLYKTTSQNCEDFVGDTEKDQPVVPYDSDQVMKSFLTYYFAPWEDPFKFYNINQLQEELTKKNEQLFKKPGWGLNRHPVSADQLADIIQNIDLATFPNLKQCAIVVRPTNLRGVPCEKTSFTHVKHTGGGYPFDNWQESLLSPNEPICVLHTSKNNVWNFVITGSHICGWVQRADIAYTTPKFIAQWQTGQYVTPLCDNVSVKDNISAPLARVGQLMPLVREQNSQEKHQVLTVATNPSGWAITKVSAVSKADTVVMPLLATPNNMARMANGLMGQPYGWGGMEGYRDCSSIIKDLLMPFGIWMPRDSGPQSKAGTFVALEGLNNDQKEQVIREQGIPFFSLIWMPGHVGLYLGTKEEKAYMYNDLWGLRTSSSTGQEGRAIVGQVAITQLDLGKEYSNIKQALLDKSVGLILLNDRLIVPHKRLELFK